MTGDMGKRIKKAREAEKLNQAQLARRVGVTQPTISDLETGEAKSTKHIVKIALALRRRPQWLLYGTPPEMVSEGDWPFSTPRHHYEALSDKANAKIDEYIADRVLVEGTQPHRKSDGAAA